MGKKIDLSELELFSGDYNDLTNKPDVPTKTSQLTNDSGFITNIPDEYVTSSELQQTLQPYNQELGEIYDWVKADYAKKEYVDNKLSGLTIIKITQAEYDALATKDPNTLYLITE